MPGHGVSKSVDSALGMGLATTFVITPGGWRVLDAGELAAGAAGAFYLRILTFILVIAAVVQFTEMVIRKMSPGLYQALGIYLPLITTNCAVLGVALLNIFNNLACSRAWCTALARPWALPGDGDLCRPARTRGAVARAAGL